MTGRRRAPARAGGVTTRRAGTDARRLARSRRRLARLAAVLTLVVVAATGTGATAGWALWSATASHRTTVTLGKVAASLEGATPRAVALTQRGTPVATTLVVRNAGTVTAGWTLTAALAAGSSASSRSLAESVAVRAWVPSGSTCGTTPPASAASGTWAAPPALSGRVAAGATVTACVVSTPGATAPGGATINPVPRLVLDAGGSWQAASEIRDLYLDSPTTWRNPATCTNESEWYARVAFDPGTTPDTSYGLWSGTRRIGTAQPTGHWPMFDLTRDVLPADQYPDGRVPVDVRVVTASGSGEVVGSAVVVASRDQYGTRRIQCG